MRALRLLLPLVLFALAAGSGAFLDGAREAAGISPSAARIPLGGFEPLAVNYLWLKGADLQKQGRFTEAATVFRRVTELQPRVVEGWIHLANVFGWTRSETPEPEVSWRWVAEGLAILDRGIANNPESVELRFARGLLFYNRLALKPGMRAIAVRELGVPPEEKAAEAFREVLARRSPHPAQAYLADSLLRLTQIREGEGDREGARAAAAESLGLFREIARDPTETGAAQRVRQLGEFLERTKPD